jgi:hypothetical protein
MFASGKEDVRICEPLLNNGKDASLEDKVCGAYYHNAINALY